MPDLRATRADTSAAHVYENEILFEIEQLLNKPVAAVATASSPLRNRRRLAPLLLLTGAAFALTLVPFSVKDALTTGRSVARGAIP